MNHFFEDNLLPKEEANIAIEEVADALIPIYQKWIDEKEFSILELSHIIINATKSMESMVLIDALQRTHELHDDESV